MGHKRQGLVRRGNVLYVRRRVPDDIRHIIGKSEFWKSLKTGDIKLADEVYWKVHDEFENQIASARRSLKPQEPKPLTKMMAEQFTKKWYSLKIEHDVDDALNAFGNIEADDFLNDLGIYEGLLSVGADEEILPTLQSHADKILIDNGYPFTDKTFASNKRKRLAKNVFVDKSSDGYWELVRLVRRGELESVRRQRAAFTGNLNSQSFDKFFANTTNQTVQLGKIVASQMSLEEAIEKFIKVNHKSHREISNSRVSFQFLKEVAGRETPIADLSKDHFYEVFDLVSSFPTNARKRKENKEKSLAEIASDAKIKELNTLHPTTINKYMRQISELMRWALDDGLVEKNLAEGKLLRASKKDVETGRDAKDPFSKTQLQTIFSEPVFRNPAIKRPAFYWVPLIALFVGMRMEEILQLVNTDIVAVEGVTVFRLHNEGKNTLKNKTAKRYVPLHPELVRLGFMSLIAAAKHNKGGRLFPDISRGASGRFSKIFSQQYSRYLVKINAKTKKTSFHSFRHNFRDACRNFDVPDNCTCEIAGWKYGSGTHTIYGSTTNIKRLDEAIHLVEYPDIDFNKINIVNWSN